MAETAPGGCFFFFFSFKAHLELWSSLLPTTWGHERCVMNVNYKHKSQTGPRSKSKWVMLNFKKF